MQPRGSAAAPRGTEIDLPSAAAAGNDAAVATTWRSSGRRLRGRLSTAALRIRRRWRSAAFRAARLDRRRRRGLPGRRGARPGQPAPAGRGADGAAGRAGHGVEHPVQRRRARARRRRSAWRWRIGFASVVGLTWWSLGILVAAPSSSASCCAWDRTSSRCRSARCSCSASGSPPAPRRPRLSRAVETLIGAASGCWSTSLFPPSVRSRYAGQAVQRLAEEIAALLEEAARGHRARLPGRRPPGRSPTRATSSPPAPAGSRSRRSTARPATSASPPTPRAAGWTTRAGSTGTSPASTARSPTRRRAGGSTSARWALRRARAACVAASRRSRCARWRCARLFRAIDDWVRGGMVEPDAAYAARARVAWTELLSDLAVAVRAFGALLRAEVEGSAEAEEAALDDALDRLRLDRRAPRGGPARGPARTPRPVGARRRPRHARRPDAAGARHRRARPGCGRSTAATSSTGTGRASCSTGCGPGARSGAAPRSRRPQVRRRHSRRAATRASRDRPVTRRHRDLTERLLAQREALTCNRLPGAPGATVDRPDPGLDTARTIGAA